MSRKEKEIDPDALAHPVSVFDDKNNVIPWDNLSTAQKLTALATLGIIRPKNNDASARGEKPGHGKEKRRKGRGRGW